MDNTYKIYRQIQEKQKQYAQFDNFEKEEIIDELLEEKRINENNLDLINNLQQRIDKAVEWCECVVNAKYTADKLPNGRTTDMGYCLDLAEPLLNILKGDDTKAESEE